MIISLKTIRAKVLALSMAVSLFTAITMFSGTLLLGFEINQSAIQAELNNVASVVAESSQAAMAFNDIHAAETNLRSLRQIEHIIKAELHYSDRELLAVYSASGETQSSVINAFLEPIEVIAAVELDGQTLGYLTITSNAAPLVAAMTSYFLLSGALLLVAVLSAYALSSLLQKYVSNPITRLRNAMKSVAGSQDNYFELPVKTEDEIALLYRGFNEMLRELAERDAALKLKARQLGEKVDIREQQLTEEEAKRIAWLQNLARFLQHELKNTMLGFRSSLDMIERRSKDANILQYIDRARNSVIFMGKLLHNVGETSGLEAVLHREAEEDFEIFDLSATTSVWVDDYISNTGYRNFKLKIENQCLIYGSPIRLMQLIEKLVANAVSHRPKNTAITIQIRHDDEHVILSVANQGAPLPKARSQIFDMFVSMREASMHDSENIGVGLYVVRIIAEAHDGYVTAENLENHDGAVFSVYLPKAATPPA